MVDGWPVGWVVGGWLGSCWVVVGWLVGWLMGGWLDGWLILSHYTLVSVCLRSCDVGDTYTLC